MVARFAAVAIAIALAACAGRVPGGADLVAESVLSGYDWRQPVERCHLPGILEEVSGLTHDGSGGLLAHHDNASTVYRVSCAGAAALGTAVEGDFEGIARRRDRLLLLTSPGVVYEAHLTSDGLGIAGPLTVATPFGRAAAGRCNFEGLEIGADGELVLACKYPRPPPPGMITLYRIDPQDGAVQLWNVDVSSVLQALRLPRLRPSGLAWVPEVGRLLVLVGKERVLLEVDPEAGLVAWRRLERRLHRQAEGLAILPDGRVAIADEADGRRPTLTLYGRCR